MNSHFKTMLGLLIISLLVLSSCEGRGIYNPTKSIRQVSIDWVDFVKLEQGKYRGVIDSVIANPSLVTEEVVGEVKFNVADEVTNPNYRIQAGDAAYLPIGTKLFRVEGFEPSELIAAEDKHSINGFRIYKAEDAITDYVKNFNEIVKHKIERIEWYSFNEKDLLSTVTGEESKELVNFIRAGEANSQYSPSYNEQDPSYYRFVIYNGAPLAYSFTVVDDGENVVFYGDEMMIMVDRNILKWLP